MLMMLCCKEVSVCKMVSSVIIEDALLNVNASFTDVLWMGTDAGF